jgi:hypothetical protein
MGQAITSATQKSMPAGSFTNKVKEAWDEVYE